MARKLFDASSLVDILIGAGGVTVGVEAVFDQHILDLTIYESSNALWKIAFARDELTATELENAISILGRIERDVSVEKATGATLLSVIQTARQTGCTFYDASYIAVASLHDLTLVTEDTAVREAAAGEDVESLSVADLPE
ncbi:type II toxin-antitoxin system VapC family toxin [Halococcus hamelinensis]|uniref:type II toxin-antitoxin system VapC family toxin n=1 Tax=Halococcus hamelinensis TaxID=332168 RepID=UPI000ABF64BF|nr:type II toxin-antitoxin system VapC family toxin [Halococcus hamelinensis]